MEEEHSIVEKIKKSDLIKLTLTDHRFKWWRKIVVFIVGMTIVLIGVALIILPGPALLVIPLGLAVLSTEFLWAKRWLRKIKEKADIATSKLSFKKKED
jgi:tellurite resistance protein TerC